MKTPEPVIDIEGDVTPDIKADIKTDITIDALDPAATDVQALVAASDAFYDGLYPEESSHLEALDDLGNPNVLFFGCRVGGKLAASGAAKLMDDDGDYAEIKRVFVLDAYRGQGLSARVMNCLESELQRRGVKLLRLETGVLQPEALGLYRKLGYHERGPFGAYGADPLSVFMEKAVSMEKAAREQNARPDPA